MILRKFSFNSKRKAKILLPSSKKKKISLNAPVFYTWHFMITRTIYFASWNIMITA